MGEKKFLIIQPAFIGDVVLATPLAQFLKSEHPDCKVHFLLRGGNEPLLQHHDFIDEVFVWHKRKGKLRQLLKVIYQIRMHRYDEVFNLHRFFSSGLITLLAKAKRKSGFDKNPLSLFYSHRRPHRIATRQNGPIVHEVMRNLSLLPDPPSKTIRPSLFPGKDDYEKVNEITQGHRYFVVAPASVWFTKQWPPERWIALLSRLPRSHRVLIIGAKGEAGMARKLLRAHPKSQDLCGSLSMLQSVALMENAERVFTNDSAPLHFASAANANHTAIFCSTVPDFGFGPLSENARIAETKINLSCRPCGLHGRKACPLKHFKCAHSISATQVFNGVEYYHAIRQESAPGTLLKVAAYFLEQNEVVGVSYGDKDYMLTTPQQYELMTQAVSNNAKLESTYLAIRDMSMLKYIVRKVPSGVFELLDQYQGRPVLLNFPTINIPATGTTKNARMAIYLPREGGLHQLLAETEGALLMTSLSTKIEQDEQIANETAFYFPVPSALTLNNALAIEVKISGEVNVAK